MAKGLAHGRSVAELHFIGEPARLLASGLLLGALNEIVDRRFRNLHGIRRNFVGQRNCHRNLSGAITKTFGEQKGRTTCAPFSFGFVVPSPSSASSAVKSIEPFQSSALSLRRSGRSPCLQVCRSPRRRRDKRRTWFERVALPDLPGLRRRVARECSRPSMPG